MLEKLKDNWSDFYSERTNQHFIHIILVAVLIRVVVMPFFGHIDVLSEARRVFFWAENNLFFDNISRNTSMLIEVLFYRATSFLIPDAESMFFYADIARSTSSIPHSFEFVSHYTIFRTLFILKLPFLVFDILTAVVLFNYFDDKKTAIDSCKLWLFNPITIFSFYIFGRFESIPIFFIAAALLALKKQRIILAAVLIGLCLNGREMMIIYSPIFILTILFASAKIIDTKRKIIAILIVFVFTAIALQLYTFIMPDIQNAVGGKVGTVMKEGRVRFLFDFNLQGVMLIPFVYALVIMWISSSSYAAHDKLLLGCALAMMSFFAFSSYTAHFTSWMILFPAIYYGYNKRILLPFCFLCLSWFAYWLIITDQGVFTFWLASPYSLHFIGLPNVPMYLEEFAGEMGIFNRTILFHLSRTAWIAALFYLAGMMLKITMQNRDNETS